MKYKAIIFDLDGTAIPNRRDGMPTRRLVQTIQKAKEKVFVCAATGRPIVMCRHLLKELNLTSPCIVAAGTQIVDPVTEKVIWEKYMDQDQVRAVVEVARKYGYPMFFNEDIEGKDPKEVLIRGPENVISIEPIPKEDAIKIQKEINSIASVVGHLVMSWEPGMNDVHITHKEATKKHSVEVLLKILNVKKEEVIGFGDSNNDLPIFESVGYKVAMENGTEELKQAADIIAPHAEADGLAEMIEKLIL